MNYPSLFKEIFQIHTNIRHNSCTVFDVKACLERLLQLINPQKTSVKLTILPAKSQIINHLPLIGVNFPHVFGRSKKQPQSGNYTATKCFNKRIKCSWIPETEGLALAPLLTVAAPAVWILPLQRHHFSLFLKTILEHPLNQSLIFKREMFISARSSWVEP